MNEEKPNDTEQEVNAEKTEPRVRVRRSLNLSDSKKSETHSDNKSKTEQPAKALTVSLPTPPIQKFGWLDVPGNAVLTWTGSPWKSRPKKMAILVAFFLLLWFIVWLIDRHNTVILLITPVILVLSTAAHFFNSSYMITDEGICWKNINMLYKGWLDVDGFTFEDDAAEIFFNKRTFRNRVNRSVTLYYDNNRAEVEAAVRECYDAKWKELRELVKQRKASTEEALARQEEE